jgi:anti-sigma factor RsiW
MHTVIVRNLEDYLAGALPPPLQQRFETHLESCGECRKQVQEMRDVTTLVASLRATEPIEPPAGFAVRVVAAVPPRFVPSFWNLFGDAAFGRRVAFASLLTLAVLGSILAARETSYAPLPHTPDVVMSAQQASSTPDSMLVTLASYEP